MAFAFECMEWVVFFFHKDASYWWLKVQRKNGVSEYFGNIIYYF